MESTIYYLENGRLIPGSADLIEPRGEKTIFGAITSEEWENISETLRVRHLISSECSKCVLTQFDDSNNFDYISLNTPDEIKSVFRGNKIGLYFSEGILLFICFMDETRFDIVSAVQNSDFKELTLSRILYVFLDELTVSDALLLESIEQEISELEEMLITSSKKNCVTDIIAQRKKLLVLKRYYEQLFTVSRSIEENQNGLIGNEMFRYFNIISNRIDRFLNELHNLRDYVTQVREAYQAQVDIELNSVMKFFTVITAIFLPLTLIVGWYGMNLSLPEFSWRYSYQFVIILSIIVVFISVLYFKKKKWF